MKTPRLALLLGLTLALSLLARAERPNIVIILADDMGFSDLSCYGGEIPTPHLDALAENGARFTQFYNTGRCCPTRASLLTGLYSHQAGIGHMNHDYGLSGYRGSLNEQCVTLAEVTRDAGYFTAISGKWHLGDRERSMWPQAHGFEAFYGVPEGGGFYFQPKNGRSIVLNDRLIGSPSQPMPDGWYCTDAFNDYGLRFIDEAGRAEKPFLLYLAHIAPHFPLQADAADIAKFRGTFRAGWEKLAEARYQRQIELGLIDPSWPKATRPSDVPAWESLSEKERDRADHLMATYAACVDRLDQSLGELVAGLKERGQLENTLILFLSDNGASAEGGTRGRTEGDPTTASSNWYCGKSWSWLQNTPFRRSKKFNHEGGIATPLIAHWPAGIPEAGWRHQVGHVIDVMPTILELTEAEYPGDPILPGEGVSLLPTFRDEALPRGPLFWEHEGNAAIRVDDWKLVRFGGKGSWELYDLKNDRTEQNNVANLHPERVQDLARQWNDWAQRCGVSPNGLPKKRS